MSVERRIATAMNRAVQQRNYRRVRDRALTRLANAYPETYKELLEQEKVVDEQLYKKWLDIDGTTGADTSADASASTYHGQTRDYYKEDEGDYGGEA